MQKRRQPVELFFSKHSRDHDKVENSILSQLSEGWKIPEYESEILMSKCTRKGTQGRKAPRLPFSILDRLQHQASTFFSYLTIHASMASTAGSTAQWSGFILKSLLRPRQQWICNTCARNQQQIRSATTGISANAAKYRRNKDQAAAAKKKKQRNTFIYSDPKKAEQFALCDAMRYASCLTTHHLYSSILIRVIDTSALSKSANHLKPPNTNSTSAYAQ